MPIRTILAAFLFLAGCAANHPARENASAAAPATTQNQAMRGLQSLTRVQLQIPGVSNAAKAEAVKQLREQLPQLDTTGSSDDWTLEFACGSMMVEESAPTMIGPRMIGPPRVSTCRCRVFKQVIVDGRSATALAYEPLLLSGKGQIVRNGQWVGPEPASMLPGAVAGFVAAWRQDNPPEEPSSGAACSTRPAAGAPTIPRLTAQELAQKTKETLDPTTDEVVPLGVPGNTHTEIINQARLMAQANQDDLAAIQRLAAKIDKDLTCPPDKGDNVRYYREDLACQQHGLLPIGFVDRGCDPKDHPSDDGVYTEFHLGAAGRLVAIVDHPQKGNRYLTDRLIYEGNDIVARLKFGAEGFQFGDYGLWRDGKLRMTARIMADGKALFFERIFWKGDHEDYTVRFVLGDRREPGKFTVQSIQFNNMRIEMNPNGTVDTVYRYNWVK